MVCLDHEGFSICSPRAIHFVSRRDRFSPALLLCLTFRLILLFAC